MPRNKKYRGFGEGPGQEPTSIFVPYQHYADGQVQSARDWEGQEDFMGAAPPGCKAEEELKS